MASSPPDGDVLIGPSPMIAAWSSVLSSGLRNWGITKSFKCSGPSSIGSRVIALLPIAAERCCKPPGICDQIRKDEIAQYFEQLEMQ